MAKSKKKQQEQEAAKPPKNPRVPTYPPQVLPLVTKLNEIIDADDDRRHLAYGLLTRLAVVWTQPPTNWPKCTVDYDVTTKLLHFDNELVRDMVHIMTELFPDGAGLPEQEGAGPL